MKNPIFRNINKALVAVLVLLIFNPLANNVLAATGSEPSTATLSTYWKYRVRRWESLVIQAAENRRIDPDFLASLVWMESRGDPSAVGPVGAIGLMQVMPKEAGFIWRPSREALMDPGINLFWGSRTLATVIGQGGGDVFNSLAAYNGGWDQIMYRGPTIFATTILRDYAHAVALRYGMQDSWIAFFARKDVSIKGPIRIADSARADVYFYGGDNILPDGTPLIPDITPSAVVAYSADDNTQEPFLVGLWLYDVNKDEWVNRPVPQITEYFLENAELVKTNPSEETPIITESPKAVSVPQPVEVQKTPEPVAPCEGGELRVDAWPLTSVVNKKGWTVTVFAEGHGGDCRYTYAWDVDENVKGVVVGGPVTFDISTPKRDATIVGTVIVKSGTETVKVPIYVEPPPK